jgi:hypothetical protein
MEKQDLQQRTAVAWLVSDPDPHSYSWLGHGARLKGKKSELRRRAGKREIRRVDVSDQKSFDFSCFAFLTSLSLINRQSSTA